MASFIPALVLLLISQIPLLLKLWLDYKSKTGSFKQELYKRQLDVFQSLVAKLTDLHEDLECVVRAFPDSRLFDEDESLQGTARGFYNKALKAQLEFYKASVAADLVMPAELSCVIGEYTHGASRIMEAAMNMPSLRGPRPNVTTLWPEQERRFNAAINIMRLSVGIDALSGDVIRDLHASGKAKLIERSSNL